MSINLPPELESRIEEEVRSGRFNSASEFVETAVKQLLPPKRATTGIYRELRRQIEESGVTLLTEEEVREEVQQRRGSRS